MMPGIDDPMLGLDDEHVAAVAIADDLILQISRRVLAAQIRFERRAQPRSLLAQLRAQARQLGAGVVVHFARRVDLAAHVGDLVLERSAVFGERLQRGEGAADAADRGARERERIEKLRECQQPQRVERAPLDRKRRQHRVEIRGRIQRERGVGVEILDAFGRRGEQLRGAMRIGLRLELGQARRAERRQRKAAHDVDDLIPLEGPQGAWLHVLRETVSIFRSRDL